MRKFIIYTFIFIAIFSFTREALALTISPIRFEISADPGEKVTKEFTLINETKEKVVYYSSFANFEAQGESGNPNFVDPKDGLGTWMTTTNSVSLEPGGTKNVPVTIEIPKNAEPGGYFSVIFWGTLPPSGTQLAIGSKTGLLVLMSVNGDVKQGGGVTEFNLKDNKFFYNTLPVDFEYKFSNDGNDRIKPEGFLRVRNTVFLLAEKLNGNPVDGNILPNSTRKFDLTWVRSPRDKDYVEPTSPILNFFDDVSYQWKNFAFGLYSAKLDLGFNDLKFDKSDRLYFFVFPWQLLILILFTLIIVFFGGNKLLKRYNKYIIKKAQTGNQLPS